MTFLNCLNTLKTLTMTNDSFSAIQKALENNWEEAADINQKMIVENPSDIDALNRLAYAYARMGKVNLAKKTYKKVLTLDKYDPIALKNLTKIEKLDKNYEYNGNTNSLSPSVFLEEPGKTKSVSLINLAPLSVISKLTIGDVVYLNAKKHTVEVRDQNKVYLGALPDDIAFRLVRLINMGNTYNTLIKNVGKNCLSVFIKEIARANKAKFQPSFLSTPTSEYSTSIGKEFIEEDQETDKDGEDDQSLEE